MARHVGRARLKFRDIHGSNPVFNIFPKWERRVCNKTVQLLCFGFVVVDEVTIGPGQARSGRASGPQRPPAPFGLPPPLDPPRESESFFFDFLDFFLGGAGGF